MQNLKQMHVLFSGRVQGVGFRYTVCRISDRFNKLTGFVRNLPGGDVELLTEGTEEDLLDFLRAIRNSNLGPNISQEQVCWRAPTGTFKRFEITF